MSHVHVDLTIAGGHILVLQLRASPLLEGSEQRVRRSLPNVKIRRRRA